MAEVNQESGKKQGKSSQKKSTRIDMTPMVDLAFLLLTFFMLTTTFSKPQTLQITMPEPPKDESEQPLVNEERVLTLILGGEDNIFWFVGITDPVVRETNYSKDGIRNVLRQQNEAIKEIVVLIKPTAKSKYKNLVDILDEMSISNISRYSLIEITEEDKALIKYKYPTL